MKLVGGYKQRLYKTSPYGKRRRITRFFFFFFFESVGVERRPYTSVTTEAITQCLRCNNLESEWSEGVDRLKD